MIRSSNGLRLPMLVGLVALASCGDASEAPVAESGMQDLVADYVIYEMEQYLTQDGVRSGVVISDSAYVFDDSTTVHLFGVDMKLYTETGSERARVTSERGWLNQRTEQMVARGNAILVVPDRDVEVRSPELNYAPGADQIFSDSVSTMRIEGRESRGTCFKSDLEFRNFSVCDPVGAIPSRTEGGS